MGRIEDIMKFLNRIGVRLALLMMLVAVATSFITLGLNAYQRERSFRELPPEVQEYLRRGEGRLPPLSLPRDLRRMLNTGEEVVVRLQTSGEADDPSAVFYVRRLSDNPASVQAIQVSVPPKRGSFEAQLQRNLWTASLVATLLGLLLAFVFARSLAGPIQAVSTAASRLARGDLKARIPNPRGQDETARLAQNFNHMAESLEKLEAERKAMIADIAHELRTPLTVMQGRLEAIQDGVIDLKASEIDRLHNQTRLLSRLVEDLRTLSLADAGKLTLERRSLDLREVVRTVAANFQAQAEARSIRLELKLPARPLTTQADPDRMAQVIGNLIANALAHTPEGGVVTVSAEVSSKEVQVRVSDTGPGIPPEALLKVFDRFYRAEASRSRQTGGSGLGLSIVKALVELHGGKVGVQNRPVGGAEFVIQLPA